MVRNKHYHYFVEGEDDKKIVDTLKTKLGLILPGKVECFNVIEKLFKPPHIMSLQYGTTVILIFDTDTGNTEILQKNIDFLKKQNNIKDILFIPQVLNLEDELIRSCSIKKIEELTKSKSSKSFKRDLLRISNLEYRLLDCNFDFTQFWNMPAPFPYKNIPNNSDKIKYNKKSS